MGNYKWHPVSEEEKEEIKKNAKNLLDEFSSKIAKIETSGAKTDGKENLRIEGSGNKTDEDFRELMMENAPMVDDGLIIAEKGGWKK